MRQKPATHPKKHAITPFLILPLLALLTVPVRAARPEPENQPDPRTRTFPHITWLTNSEQGRPHVLFIANSGSAWELYALAMRMELDYEVFYTNGGRCGVFAPKTDYYHEGIRLYPQAVKELRELLKKKWEAIAIIDAPPYSFPSEINYRLLELARQGTGIVTFNCPRWQTDFRYAGLKKEKISDLFASLPQAALTLPKYKVKKKVVSDQRGVLLSPSFVDTVEPYKFKPIEKIQLGKGVVYNVVLGGGNYFGGHAIAPALRQDPDELVQEEYFYSLGAKVLLLAANHAPAVRLQSLDADGKTFAPGQPIPVAAAVSGPFTGTAKIVVRNHQNQILAQKGMPIALDKAGKAQLELPPLPAGRYFVDVWLQRGKSLFKKAKTVDWASAGFTVKDAKIQIAGIDLPQWSLTPSQTLAATLRVAGASNGLTVRAELADAENRVIVEQDHIAVNQGRASIKLPLARCLEQYHMLNLELRHNGLTLDSVRRLVVVRQPLEKDLVVFADGDNRGLIAARRQHIFREYGVNLLQIMGSDRDAIDPRMVLYTGQHVATRIWLTHCDRYTGGCISSTTYPAAVSRTFQQTTEFLKPYGLAFFSIGDDSGVGADFCNSYPNWMRSYIEKMANRYQGNINAWSKDHGKNRTWGAFRYMASQAKVKELLAIIAKKPLPDDLKILKQCWRENYGTIQAFNRASNTNFKSFAAIDIPDLAKIGKVNPCLLGFRDATKARYGGIARLNRAWGTKLKSFEEITNPLIEKWTAQGKVGAKLDKIWYLENLFIRNMAAVRKGVRAVAPNIGIGMGAASFGNIIPEVLQQIDSSMPYKGDLQFEIIRSVPHRYCGQTIGVYGGKKVTAAARENQAWETLFTGGNFIWFWAMSAGGLMGDLSMNPGRSGIMLQNIREMQNGIARALIQGKRLHNGIAILHERRAGTFSQLRKELGAVKSSEVGFQRIIEDLGMQYRYTWTQEVESGVLTTNEFRVLILPYTQILSAKEVKAIKKFVQNGGTLIADFRVATHDWNGNPLKQGQLDDLFGIRQNCAAAQPIKGQMRWLLNPDGTPIAAPVKIPGLRGDARVKSHGARALATMGKTPMVLVQTVGKGRAIFLNHAPTTYANLLNRNQATDLRALYRELFATAGVQRRFKVQDQNSNDISGAELAVFRHGPIDYLTLEKNSYEFEHYPIQGKILLDRFYDVYNTRTGQSFGWVNQIPVTLKGLGCYVYTLLPYRVQALRADITRRVRGGGTIAITAQILTCDHAAPGPHTLRIDRFRPDGSRLWPIIKRETKNGRLSVSLPVAINEKTGKWRVVVTDVTTGKKISRPVTITRNQ